MLKFEKIVITQIVKRAAAKSRTKILPIYLSWMKQFNRNQAINHRQYVINWYTSNNVSFIHKYWHVTKLWLIHFLAITHFRANWTANFGWTSRNYYRSNGHGKPKLWCSFFTFGEKMGVATRRTPNGPRPPDQTKTLADWVDLLGQPLSQNHVLEFFRPETHVLKKVRKTWYNNKRRCYDILWQLKFSDWLKPHVRGSRFYGQITLLTK